MFTTVTIESPTALSETNKCLKKIIAILEGKRFNTKRIERYLAWNMFFLARLLIKGIVFK